MCFQRKCILLFSQGEYVLQTWFCTRSAPRAAEGHLVQKSSWFRVTSHEAETLGIAPLATGILLKSASRDLCCLLSDIAKVSVRQVTHEHRWMRDTLQKKTELVLQLNHGTAQASHCRAQARTVWWQASLQYLEEGLKCSLMIPIKVSRDATLHWFFLFTRYVTSVLFFSNGYEKHVMLEQVWQFQFQLPAGFSISFYESLKRCSILL